MHQTCFDTDAPHLRINSPTVRLLDRLTELLSLLRREIREIEGVISPNEMLAG